LNLNNDSVQSLAYFGCINHAAVALNVLSRFCLLLPHFNVFFLQLTFPRLWFRFHLHGRTQLDVLIHTLLLYVVYANVLVIVLEIRYRHSVIVALARAYTVLLQGTWFWQVRQFNVEMATNTHTPV